MKNNNGFIKALKIGRPPNIVSLFPNSKALIVSGKFIDRGMIEKGKAIALAANARSYFVIKGVLLGAQRANSAIIIEIAKSEGGQDGYCAVNFWNIARIVDSLCNELKISVPVAVHADHYKIKNKEDIKIAETEIPSIFEAGITSIAIDASSMPEDENLNANIFLSSYIPQWAGFETEVGEIKGALGLSSIEDTLFLVKGLNAYDIFPDWIALNNGTTHGIEKKESIGIQVELTKEIHEALLPYKISGAQHGTSGNALESLKKIAKETRTTKANVATALQMISWGLEVNEAGNAKQNDQDGFIKIKNAGVSEEMWAQMAAYAHKKGLAGSKINKLNLPFENKLLSQSKDIRERMVKRVEDFVYNLLTDVFNSTDTAPIVYEKIIKANSYHSGVKAYRIESSEDWTPEQIKLKASMIYSQNLNTIREESFDD